ncbi:MAG: ABC transporter permease [Melioribacteraceae bacterium]|nr:ABC transporter permease [Melioribacteraceae bacterium]MDD3557176.1 ABC transporter permease [Melioribacteraceae bacterium]
MLSRIAWKNIWRNKLRSGIIITSISLGLFGGVFAIAFMNGMANQMINDLINLELANIQLHNPQFLLNDETIYTIENPEKKIERIKKIEQVKSVSSRTVRMGMASSSSTGKGVRINGINPEIEKQTTELSDKIIEGSFLEDERKNQIVVGEKLVKELKLKLNSKVILTLQTIDNNITYAAFRITGIFKTQNTMFDESNVFVRDKELKEIVHLRENRTNEIVVALSDNDFTKQVKSKLINEFEKEIHNEKLIVRTWDEINPSVKMIQQMSLQFSFIFVIIILVALSFGITNTMLMVVMERVRELGMLMAVGMNKIKLAGMIFFETLYLSLTGAFAGMIISVGAISIAAKTGIDLSPIAEGFNAYGYSSIIYPEIDTAFYFYVMFFVVITAFLASVYPARKALKFNPAEAVRTEA